MNFRFYFNSILLGIGLAMDAFSVSLVNGLNEPKMSKSKAFGISFCFGIFQYAMPIIGWVCVHYLLETFNSFQKYIPWIAFGLLLYIGGKMIIEGLRKEENEEKPAVGFMGLMIQGVATSIDALSVGFAIANYNFLIANIECIIIGIVTSIICVFGIKIGKKFGTRFSRSASIIGGIILVSIGLEILISGLI